MVLVIKSLPTSAGDIRDTGSIPELGRSPGGRHGKPHSLQYSSLENSMDYIVHEVSKCQSQLNNFHFHKMHKKFLWKFIFINLFPGSSDGRICLQYEKPGFNPWVGKIPWRWKWQPTPVFLPGKFHGWRTLAGYSPWGHKKT